MDHVYEVITSKQAEIIRVQHEIHQLQEWIRHVETDQAAKEQIKQMGRHAEKQAREKNATTVVMALVGLFTGSPFTPLITSIGLNPSFSKMLPG